MALPKIITIVGPTASGKTSISIELAKVFSGEVIVADSRQVYKNMNIGTAKPEGEWREQEIAVGGSIDQLFGARRTFFVEDVPHFGFDLVEPGEDFSVAEWKIKAKEYISDITKRQRVPFVVGGTGLFIRSIVDNLDLPEVPPNLALRAELEKKPLSTLVYEYKTLDPKGVELIDKTNPRRLIRAIEVSKVLGKPFSEAKSQGKPLYDVLELGISWPREELNKRIDERVDIMVAQGLVNEVRDLQNKYGKDAIGMDGIGYKEISNFFAGKYSLKEAIADIKIHTKQYAKRQMTWFNRDNRIHWVQSTQEAEKLVRDFLKN